jgi:hypothetical protein
VHGKACSAIIYKARSITKASKIVATVEIMYYALNKISFFVNNSKAIGALARAKVRASIRKDDFIKLRPGLS